MEKVRVRYAPSPTGHLHIGGARTALFNYLFAKHYQGDFIFRLEDTDVERNIVGGEESQLENLAWLGIVPDESPYRPNPKYAPYRQMERLDIYRHYAQWLLEQGYAYKCFCTQEMLEQEHERQVSEGIAPRYNGRCAFLSPEEVALKEAQGQPYTIRLRVPENKTYAFEDMIRGHVSFESRDIGDWVIVKANGIPTYNFAVVIDDHCMDITHVFRGEEHLSNTPKQLMLYDLLGWKAPQYGHMTLIVNENRKKLSKRDESIMQFVSQYRDEGYIPEAMFNFLALLGWSPEGEQEIFSKEELIQHFNEKRLSRSPSMFDRDKLTWVSNRYMKDKSIQEAVEWCLPFLKEAYDLSHRSSEWIQMLVETYHAQLSYGKEIVPLVSYFFEQEITLDEEAQQFMLQEDVKKPLLALRQYIEKMDVLTKENVKESIKKVQQETLVKGKMLYMPIRIALTGQMHGPDLSSILTLLGKETVLKRLDRTLLS